MILGSAILGSEIPAEGLIRNLHIVQAGTDSVAAEYVHQGFVEGEHHALAYMDGSLAAIDSSGVAVVGGLATGAHNINLVPQIEYHTVPVTFFDEDDGRRVLLSWNPAAGDVASYRVYQVDLDGNNPVLLNEITIRSVASAFMKYPTTGSGMGRISVAPTPVPAGVNAALKIIISGTGAYTWELGAASGSGNFARGTVITVAHNIKVVFTDDAPEYVTGDEFELWCGPERRWTSQALAPGDYRYAVAAVGLDGYESAKALTQIYEIVELPDGAQTDVVWDNTAKTLTISFSGTMRLYSNWYADEGYFDDYVSLMPQQTASGSFVISFGSAEGIFSYYLRSYDAENDVENPEFTLREITIPATDYGVILGTPINLQGSARGMMGWMAAFDYEILENDDVTRLDLYRVQAGDEFTYDTSDRVATLTPSPLRTRYEVTVDDSALDPGDIMIVAVAHAGPGDIDPKTLSNVVTITISDTPSVSAPGGVAGGTV